ncbi:MAG: ribokinase [Pirellulaceae bacterium]
MSAIEILVLGSINQDLVIRGQRIPQPGETVLGGAFYRVAGGKGANQAVACSRASHVPVWLAAAVGQDLFGEQAQADLSTEKLVTTEIREMEGYATGVALILVDEQGENCISVASGANGQLQPDHLPAEKCSIWSPGNYLLVSLEIPWETAAAALRQAQAAGMTTILNPAPATAALAREDKFQHIDVLTPNAHEASLLTGSVVNDIASAMRAAEQLQQRGCRHIIVTLGQQGLVLRQDNEAIHVPAQPVTAVDTTAAGDCFNGALIAALATGKPLAWATRWANVAASLSVGRQGAQPSLPTFAEIEARWREIPSQGSLE